ncbi:hypothetical protein [Paenibacillus sanguinis]|uniref:hypothetical protein n=1 Tax=Paenibacillus sanguinis TaxID=225906 RepID=UPI0003711240|nr:hypothetical protein [Paenibacillus sanguinis]
MIYVDDTGVKVGGVVLPGLFKSIEIKGEATVEEQEVQGKTAKPKQATGYEDGKITLELILEDSPNMTKLRRLEIIQKLFQKPGQTKPEVHTFVSSHSSVRGINKVIFKSLASREQNNTSSIAVTIELWQYVATKITATKKGSSKSSSKKTTAKAAAKPSSTLSADYKSYLTSDRGAAPKTTNKTSKTAAVDNKNTSVYKNGILRMPM